MAERLQKLLAQRGLGSRREIETWIAQGTVTVNGKTAVLGTKAEPSDIIKVHNRLVKLIEVKAPPRVLMYHKPEQEVCTRKDPEGRPTVYDQLPDILQGRWISVGRLDFNTSGLLLFTNDGELANRLMHPSYEFDREYAVRVYGKVSPEILNKLLQGVKLEDGFAKFLSIKDGGGEGKNHWYHVTLKEGRNREVRRMWESQEITVSRLIRIRYGNITLPKGLRQGHHEEMTLSQVNALLHTVELPEYQMPQPAKLSAKTFAAKKTKTRTGEPKPTRKKVEFKKRSRYPQDQ